MTNLYMYTYTFIYTTQLVIVLNSHITLSSSMNTKNGAMWHNHALLCHSIPTYTCVHQSLSRPLHTLYLGYIVCIRELSPRCT